MKITKSQIKKIIQEEIENLMREVEGIHSREVTQLLDDPSTFTRKTAGGAFDLARSFPGSPYGGAGNQAWYQRNTDKLDQGPEDKSGFVVSPVLPPMTHKEFTAARERGDAVAGSATKAYGKPGRLGVLTPDLKKALRSMKDRVLGSTASKTKGTEKPLSPLKYDPKKHAFEENMQIDSRLPPAPKPKKQVPLNRDFEKVFGTEDPLAGIVDPESPIPKELFDRVRAMGKRFKARGKAAEKRPDVNDPKKYALEEDVVSVKDLDLDETSSKARREEQVNETDRFKQAVEKSRNLRRNTPADKERRKNDAAYEKGLKTIKRTRNKKNRRFARQPAKK